MENAGIYMRHGFDSCKMDLYGEYRTVRRLFYHGVHVANVFSLVRVRGLNGTDSHMPYILSCFASKAQVLNLKFKFKSLFHNKMPEERGILYEWCNKTYGICYTKDATEKQIENIERIFQSDQTIP